MNPRLSLSSFFLVLSAGLSVGGACRCKDQPAQPTAEPGVATPSAPPAASSAGVPEPELAETAGQEPDPVDDFVAVTNLTDVEGTWKTDSGTAVIIEPWPAGKAVPYPWRLQYTYKKGPTSCGLFEEQQQPSAWDPIPWFVGSCEGGSFRVGARTLVRVIMEMKHAGTERFLKVMVGDETVTAKQD